MEEGSSGFLGIGSKPAVIRARVKEESEMEEKPVSAKPVEAKAETGKPVQEKAEGKKPAAKSLKTEGPLEDEAKKFLNSVFAAMNMVVTVDVNYDEAEKNMDIELS